MKKRTSFSRILAMLACIIAIILCIFFMRESAREGLAPDTLAQSGSAQSDPVQPKSTAKVHFVDVGQGDCTLIEADGHYMLIDAGEYDQADKVIEYLKSLDIERLDYVIGTHPHSDHIGALDRVINTFKVRCAIVPPKEYATKSYQDLIKAIEKQGLKITNPVPGDIYGLGGSTFQILAPNKDYGDDINSWSVGIRFVCGGTSFVLCGDAGTVAEEDMLANDLTLRADVLKVSHHGSYSSSTNDFLDAVQPDYAVIECGQGNDYGYPHGKILYQLNNRNVKIYRTDTQGTVVAATDGTVLTWTTEKEPPAQ